MSGAAAIQIFSWVSVLASALIVWKLARTKLHRKYTVFFVYLIFRTLSNACILPLDVTSKTYFYAWISVEPISLIFYGLVILELCRLVLERHKGLYTLGKWAMIVGIVISIAVSVMTYLAHFKSAALQHRASHASPSNLIYFYLADRGVTCCLAVFLVLMLVLLSRYPVPLPRNVILHVSIYSAFFWSNTLSMILTSVFGVHLFTAIDAGLMGISAVCCAAWLLFLTPAGEEVRVNIPHFDPQQEERILLHLDNLNSTLLKVSRK